MIISVLEAERLRLRGFEEENMIKYTDDISNIKERDINGFFVDWPNPPSPIKHLEILKNSSHVFLALNKTACRR